MRETDKSTSENNSKIVAPAIKYRAELMVCVEVWPAHVGGQDARGGLGAR